MSILGLDIGGTNTKLAIASGNFSTKGFPLTIPTSYPIEIFLISIFKDYLNENIKKIGISIAGNVNSQGILINTTNLKIKTPFPIKEFIEKHTKRECRVINDGNASALAISKMKEYSGYSSLVSVTLGTGIGGGIVLNGRVLTSKNGLDSEIGHITVIPDGERCPCGNRGCVEVYCGERGIVKRYNKIGNTKITRAIELKHLLDRGDKNAIKITIETGKLIGQALTTITNTLGVEAFVFGGGVCGLGTTLIETIANYIRKHCFGSKLGIFPEVRVTKNSQYLSLLGALELFNE